MPAQTGSGAPQLTSEALTIRAAEAESQMLYVAGAAKPGSLVQVYADDKLVGRAQADTNGTWLLEAVKQVPAGKVVLRADAVHPDLPGKTQEVRLPFLRYTDGIVLEPLASADKGTEAVAPDARMPQPLSVIIRRGDNLWRLSQRNYGRGIRYQTIFAANRDQIQNPHWIYPGQVFVVPTRDRNWETATD